VPANEKQKNLPQSLRRDRRLGSATAIRLLRISFAFLRLFAAIGFRIV
jgi:hypothetical protein